MRWDFQALIFKVRPLVQYTIRAVDSAYHNPTIDTHKPACRKHLDSHIVIDFTLRRLLHRAHH